MTAPTTFPVYCYGVGCWIRPACARYRAVDNMPAGEIVAGSCLGTAKQDNGRPWQFQPITETKEATA